MSKPNSNLNPSIYDSAILITGPDINLEPVKNFLVKRIPNIFFIGDGKSSIIINEEDEGEYRDGLLKIKGLEEFTSPTTRTLVVVDAHGNIDYKGDHVISLRKNETQQITRETQHFLKNLVDALNKPIDIIFTPCYGGGALKDIDILPTGSRIAILSQKNEVTHNPNYHQLFANTFPEEVSFSLDTFYEYYLLNIITTEHPIFAEVGGKIIDTSLYMEGPLNEEEKNYAKDKLVDLCRKNDTCITRTNNILENLKSNYLLAEPAMQKIAYYPALVEIIFSIANFSIMYPSSYECGIEWYKMKNETDKIFEQYFIPLSLNLEEIDMEENLTEEEMDDVMAATALFHNPAYPTAYNYLIYATLKDWGTPNDNFPTPEQPNHGVELLISMYVEEYRSSFADTI